MKMAFLSSIKNLQFALACLLIIVISLTTTTTTTTTASTDVSKRPQAAERIRNEPESVWVEFIQLALDYKPLNLGQGFPDFAAPAYLVESLTNATQLTAQSTTSNILNHQYTRSFGHPRLVRALRDYYKKWRNFSELVDEKSQVLVTVGAYEALFTAIMAFVNPGDEVIVIDPAFDAYAPMVSMAGGKNVFIPLRQVHDDNSSSLSTAQFKLDMGEFEAKISNRTRVLVLNTPNNPLGKIYSRQELEQLARLCRQHNLLVIADEVYEQFYHDPNEAPHVSVASLPGMWERTITIGSAGKTFSVTGWKIGWAFGAPHLIRYMQLVHQTAVYTVATPLQEAIARALEHEMAILSGDVVEVGKLQYWEELRQELKRKRDRMSRVLERANMRPIVPQGGYFMLADFSQLAGRFPEYLNSSASTSSAIQTNDYKFARWLSRVKHLQGIPGGAFYSSSNKALGANTIRLCFIKSDATLDKFEKLIDQLNLST